MEVPKFGTEKKLTCKIGDFGLAVKIKIKIEKQNIRGRVTKDIKFSRNTKIRTTRDFTRYFKN
jgi:hypothetical protein